MPTVGAGPSDRSAPAAVGIGEALYVFGGARDDFATGDATFYNDLHRLDVATNRWTIVRPSGTPPAPRAFAAAAAQPAARRMFVFGGAVFDVAGSQFTPLGDLWSYAAGANRWTRLESVTAAGPGARSGALLWVVGDRLYLFGGIDATFTTHNDLWAFDLRRSAWTPVAMAGPAPPPRHMAQAGAAVGNRLTLYGGEGLDPAVGFTMLSDTWQADLALRRWREVTPVWANVAPPRNYGAAAVVGTGLYLHGGDVPGGEAGCGAPFAQNPTDELWRFDLTGLTWRRLHPTGDPPVRLKRHAAATVAGRIYVVSGWDFRCPGGAGPGQLWNRNVYSLTP